MKDFLYANDFCGQGDRMLPSKAGNTGMNVCQRCGSCCRKNPPALHSEDKELYTQSVLKRQHLITFRQGEYVYDNVEDQVLPLEQELVRIRSKPGLRECIFYDHVRRACGIYAHRPLECRLFVCWDPTALMQVYAQDRIQRLDLIADHSGLGQLIADHEKICSWNRVLELLPCVRRNPESDHGREMAEILGMDQGLRQALRNQTGAVDVDLGFLLGRPIVSVLPSLGLKAVHTGEGFRFQIPGS
jgi:Fe-S-cluster containining protein